MKHFKKNASVLDLILYMNFLSKKLKFTLLNKKFELERLPTHYTNLKLEYYILKES